MYNHQDYIEANKKHIPTYKIGDWLRVIRGSGRPIGKVFQITERTVCIKAYDVELWKPIKGELCWFLDASDQREVILSTFNKVIVRSSDKLYSDITGCYWYICEPFIGNPPACLEKG